MNSCTSHHHACACREHKVAVLIKAALDAATDLDGLNGAIHRCGLNGNYIPKVIEISEFEHVRSVVERVYDACEALGVEIGANEQQRRVIGCKRIDGGADCYSNLGCKGCQNAIYEGQAANQSEVPA